MLGRYLAFRLRRKAFELWRKIPKTVAPSPISNSDFEKWRAGRQFSAGLLDEYVSEQLGKGLPIHLEIEEDNETKLSEILNFQNLDFHYLKINLGDRKKTQL